MQVHSRAYTSAHTNTHTHTRMRKTQPEHLLTCCFYILYITININDKHVHTLNLIHIFIYK